MFYSKYKEWPMASLELPDLNFIDLIEVHNGFKSCFYQKKLH